jgi:hypothetical protein
MNLLKLSLLQVMLLLCLSVNSQSLYRSIEFDHAVENGTRTYDGLPGENYKGNFSEYKIDAEFNPATQMLTGEETVVFHYNLGPNYNTKVVFNLYRNIYKKGATRSRNCNQEDITDEGMEILEVKQILASGAKSNCKFEVDNTHLIVNLESRMKKGDVVKFTVKWQNKIAANTHHRGGKYGTNTWFIPYWYPQIAVCDDIYGWDNIEHSANEEFLLEFANYDVNIKLGNKMCAWATGVLQNSADIYSKSVLANIAKAEKSNTNIEIINAENRGKALKKDENIWHFKADSVPDFVFCCSDSAFWEMSSLDLLKKRRTLASIVYFNKGFKYVLDFTKKTLSYLSTERPGIPYPYAHMTIFEGSGGMEFPMMVNEDFDDNYDSDLFTTSHEVVHSFYPFITGMYQNRFAFMDEGLTMYVPQYFQVKESKNDNIIRNAANILRYTQGMDSNVPIATPSYMQSPDLMVYTVNSYYKPQMAYTFLENIVGSETMSKILKTFTQNWAGKHPHPFDFFNLCKKISGTNLDEYFYSWFYTTDFPDLAITQVKDNVITIQNPGRLMLPIYMTVNYEDGTTETIERNALCWAFGNNAVNMSVNKKIKSVDLGNSEIPDVNDKDNHWKAN